ncbi:hypothetical protein B0T26DRAFT_689490 [Lasiosphaeria miniovina]|uniref:Uncharacterized protein n=1 Tax=Lasiosphaeria miniovina TaxID=1954250 RepID=A0AA40EEP2_9PEZI|nr:uncharacterized protein B0T26DRAFT_689490 [Lasiosphaeria miniovina]KAK0734721.1 hypothetical protein B0T26DRAFT_689490 [Lasiosphaeria miniovina]
MPSRRVTGRVQSQRDAVGQHGAHLREPAQRADGRDHVERGVRVDGGERAEQVRVGTRRRRAAEPRV